VLLWIGWLLVAIGWLDQPRPHPSNSAGLIAIDIPAIGVQATVVGVGLQADGGHAGPDPDEAGWYTLGPRPAAPGPPCSSATWTPAPARPSSTASANSARATRSWSPAAGPPAASRSSGWRQPKTALPTRPTWTASTRPLLRLVTCGGSFNQATGHYRDNLSVYASPTGN
jgi:hypothetical protein